MEEINILDLNINFGDTVKQTAALQKTIQELTKQIVELKEAEGDNTEEIIKQEAALKNLQRDYRTNTKLIQDLQKASSENVKTVEQGRRALSAVSTLWAQQASLYGENNESVKALAAQKLELTNRLKELEAATGDNRRNVGNYTQSILEAVRSSGGLTQSTVKLFDTLKANPFVLLLDLLVKLGNAISKNQGIVDAFNRAWLPLQQTLDFLVGLISEGVLVVFGKLQGLTTDFTGTVKGLGQAIVDNIINRFKAFKVLAEGVSLLFEGKVSQALKTFGDGVIQLGTGVENATDKIASFGKGVQNAFQTGQNVAKLREEIRDLELQATQAEAANRKRVSELRLIAADEEVSEQKRLAALKEANKIENENAALQEKIVKRRIELLEAEASTSRTGAADLQAIEEQKAKLFEIEQGRNNRQREILSATNGLRARLAAEEKARIAEQQKLAQEALNEEARIAEERIKIFELANKTRIKEDTILTAELAAEEIKRETELLKLREDFFRKQLAAGKISQVEFAALVDGLNRQFDDFATGLSERAAVQAITRLTDAVLDSRRRLAEGRLGAGLITEQDIREQIKLLRQLQSDEEAVLTARFEQGLIREAEYQLQLAEVRIRGREAVAKLEVDFATQENQREAIDFANRIAILAANNENQLEIRRLQLERQREIEIAAAEQTGADILLINEKYAALNRELERQSQQAKLQIASNYLTAFAELVGENTAFGKLAASAAALINTFEAITIALTAPTLPQRIAGVAFATATGLAAVARINSTPTPTAPAQKSIPKLAKGGIAGGDLHSGGGTKYYGEDGNVVELERGENWYVLNRAASAAINRLSSLNESFGGNSFASKPSNYLQDGGLARAIPRDAIDQRPIVVDVKDIITQTARRVQLVDSATL